MPTLSQQWHRRAGWTALRPGACELNLKHPIALCFDCVDELSGNAFKSNLGPPSGIDAWLSSVCPHA
jgi:hypothetical protein